VTVGIALRAVLALGVVVVLMYLFFLWIKRMYLGRKGMGRLLRVLDVVPVGSKGVVCAIRVGERVLIVGATEGMVSLLCELEGEEAAELFPQEEEFPGLLQAAVGKLKGKRG